MFGCRQIVLTLGAATLLVGAACSSKSSTSGAKATQSDAGSSGGFNSSGGEDAGLGRACASKEAVAVAGPRPVDIIFAIDNSSSMAEEIGEVEQQINMNFASIIDASKTDYRVIMLSRHGAHGTTSDSLQRICVQAPLSGTTCDPIPASPAETPHFFQHDVVINSNDSLCQILTTYRTADRAGHHPQGWAAFLRPEAFKVFAVITDDRVATAPCAGWPAFDDHDVDTVNATTVGATFDNALLAMDPAQFGSATRRNYIWHSIVGVAPFDADDLSKPYPSSAPLVTDHCTPGSESPGLGYQAISKLSGGLRYPTCGLDYTAVFKAMASGVVDHAVLECGYEMPPDPPEGKIDPDTTIIQYTSGATVTNFTKVSDASACGPAKFYLEGAHITLCPDACRTVQADPAAQVKVLFGCFTKTN